MTEGDGTVATPLPPATAPSQPATNGPRAPLTVATLTDEKNPNAPARAVVMGKTYDYRLPLAAYGGHFDKERQLWTFDNEQQARDAVNDCSRLFAMRAARRGGGA